MREDLFEKLTKKLRDNVRSNLHLYRTFHELKHYISLIYWLLEDEKKRTLRTTQNSSSNKPIYSARTILARTATKEEKRKPTYSNKCKIELSAKGACFNLEQIGHMAKDCRKGIKTLEANEMLEKKTLRRKTPT